MNSQQIAKILSTALVPVTVKQCSWSGC